MATSSFSKNYYVPKSKADEFVEEMTRDIPPTLTKDFKTQFKRGKAAKLFLQKIL